MSPAKIIVLILCASVLYLGVVSWKETHSTKPEIAYPSPPEMTTTCFEHLPAYAQNEVRKGDSVSCGDQNNR